MEMFLVDMALRLFLASAVILISSGLLYGTLYWCTGSLGVSRSTICKKVLRATSATFFISATVHLLLIMGFTVAGN